MGNQILERLGYLVTARASSFDNNRFVRLTRHKTIFANLVLAADMFESVNQKIPIQPYST
jgi:hypothetical protein